MLEDFINIKLPNKFKLPEEKQKSIVKTISDRESTLSLFVILTKKNKNGEISFADHPVILISPELNYLEWDSFYFSNEDDLIASEFLGSDNLKTNFEYIDELIDLGVSYGYPDLVLGFVNTINNGYPEFNQICYIENFNLTKPYGALEYAYKKALKIIFSEDGLLLPRVDNSIHYLQEVNPIITREHILILINRLKKSVKKLIIDNDNNLKNQHIIFLYTFMKFQHDHLLKYNNSTKLDIVFFLKTIGILEILPYEYNLSEVRLSPLVDGKENNLFYDLPELSDNDGFIFNQKESNIKGEGGFSFYFKFSPLFLESIKKTTK